jgi:CBS domain containing-hemolysin-like protein
MFTFLLILTILAFILLLIVAAVRPVHSKFNLFELERRAGLCDKRAIKALEREKLLGDVISLQRLLIALLQVVVVVLSELTFGLLIGILAAFLMALGYGPIANFGFLRNWSQKLYERVEDPALRLIQRFPLIFKILRSTPSGHHTYSLRIDSREELQNLVAESDDVLTPDEKKLIVNSLSFNDQHVGTVMTPRDMINSIKKSEFLGPLALNDLHQLGHSRLPVIGRDIDHIVGILHLRGLLTLDVKRSMTAEKAMEPKVYYIREDQTLHHALAAFLRTRHLLFIVVNKSRETVGLLTLEDVIEALIGRKIVDEFDSHDDLHTVALRNLHAKNRPREYEDI